MYTYKTEILTVSTKWFSEGWELAAYDYMGTSTQIKGAFVVTFRKETA